MLSFKRKRDEFEDSDDEEPAFGKQILPVANLPEDFNDEPTDGMQYLFTVRRDARHLPHVTRVPNPFEKEDSIQHDDRVLPSHTTLPSEEWRVLLGTRFRNFRQNMNQPTIYVQLPEKALHKLMPEKKERDLWWAYLAGKPESDWNPPKPPKQNTKKSPKYRRGMRGFADDPGTSGSSQQEPWQCDEGEVEDVLRVDPKESLPTPTCSPEPPEVSTSTEAQIMGPSLAVMDFSPPRPPVLKPREPMPSLLEHIDQKMALHLLMYFAHWFNLYLQQPDPTSLPLEAHARWIFALLAKVEDHISADDMSQLRNLARACLGLLEESIKTRTSLGTSNAADSLGGEQEIMSERACWIIVCIIVGVWGQRDLWMDAEDMLKTL